MTQKFRSVLAVLTLTVGFTTTNAHARNFLVSSQIPNDQALQLQQDFKTDLTLMDDNPEAKAILGVPNLKDGTLRTWITARVGYILSENEDTATRLTPMGRYTYQNPGVFPDFETPKPGNSGGSALSQSGDDNQKVVTVMSNVGTAIYYFGKDKNVLVGYNFPTAKGDKVIPVSSPRTGLIKIGQGLFMVKLIKDNDASIANRDFRIATFFHEAHHSDGNAKSLGFPHAVCPTGHAYAGRNACDRNANGPYAVGANVMKQQRATCLNAKSCSAKEAEMLAFASLDSFSRVLSTVNWDATPEGH